MTLKWIMMASLYLSRFIDALMLLFIGAALMLRFCCVPTSVKGHYKKTTYKKITSEQHQGSAPCAAVASHSSGTLRYSGRLAVFRSVLALNVVGQLAGPFAWGKGSCLELVFARDAWRDAWFRAEDQDGQEQLADILDRPNAWDPSPSVAENVPYQKTRQKGSSR